MAVTIRELREEIGTLGAEVDQLRKGAPPPAE